MSAEVTGSRLYFDHNAGAPLRPAARAAMIEALDAAGNPSSVHSEGRTARQRVEAARRAVAELVRAEPDGVTFTGGGTEANVTALGPDWTIEGRPVRFDALIVGATEHPSVLAGGRFPPELVRVLPVDAAGRADPAQLQEMLADDNAAGRQVLVSVMLANNETGTIQPVAELAAVAHEAGALFHADTIQAAGRIPIDIAALGADVLTLSAHKLGGPQGVGAVVLGRPDIAFAPLLGGGAQERRSRAGTENVAAIAGFGAAAEAARREADEMAETWQGWRDDLAAALAAGSPRQLTIFAEAAARLPQTLCVGVHGVAAETLLIALDLAGVAVSSGAACSSGKVATSPVLAAMGVAPKEARTAIRISFGWETRPEHLHRLQTIWRDVVGQISSGGEARAA